MKKGLTILLVIVLLLGGLFLWKGGHHAIFMAAELDQWLDSEASDQYIQMTFDGVSMEGEAFWVDRSGRSVYGLSAGEYSLYLRDNVLYTDTGKAYSLPSFQEESEKLLWSALIYGRITKEDGVRQLNMEQEQLTLHAAMDDNGDVQLNAHFNLNGTAHDLSLSVQRLETTSHTIPRTVVDAMVRADMEPPISILEPLEAVGPALSALEQLQADVDVTVECGILNLNEQLWLSAGAEGIKLKRQGIEIDLPLPQGFAAAEPMHLGLLFLRNGDFERINDGAVLRLQIPADTVDEMMVSMIPQIEGLDIHYQDSILELTIAGEKLESIRMESSGSVPFLITEIPISITMDCRIT